MNAAFPHLKESTKLEEQDCKGWTQTKNSAYERCVRILGTCVNRSSNELPMNGGTGKKPQLEVQLKTNLLHKMNKLTPSIG